VIRPALLGLIATALVWVPAVARGIHVVLHGGVPLRDPVLWLLLVAGVVYFPIAVAHAALGGSILGLLNPIPMARSALRFGADYLVAVGALVALAILHATLLVAGAVLLGRIPVVSEVLRHALALVAPLMGARVIGLLLFVRGDAIGLGRDEDYLEPVLVGATPRGAPPVLSRLPAPPPVTAPLEPELEPTPPAIALTPRPGALIAERIERVEPPAPADPAVAVAEAVRRGDLRAAATAFAALDGKTGAVPPRVLFQAAKGAAQGGDHALAARALTAAARTFDPAVAPDAMLVLGRIYQQRLARPDDARKVLEELLRRFPESGAAVQARALIPPVG
jgi:hypothetical protein